MRGRPARPSTSASARPSGPNSSLQTTAVGTPAFSSSTESWTLHDVQLPQSEIARTTASQRCRRPMTSSGHGEVATLYSVTIFKSG